MAERELGEVGNKKIINLVCPDFNGGIDPYYLDKFDRNVVRIEEERDIEDLMGALANLRGMGRDIGYTLSSYNGTKYAFVERR